MKGKERKIDGDFFDYLQWRGDLSFSNSAFCEVDALILCQLSYIKFNDIVASSFDLCEAVDSCGTNTDSRCGGLCGTNTDSRGGTSCDGVSDLKKGRSLAECASFYKKLPAKDERKNLGLLINPDTKKLLDLCAASTRFSSLQLCGFSDSFDLDKVEQFCAMTFVCKEEKFIFIAFRGTDDTLVGWKEDFNLSFMESVPAQEDSLKYLKSVLENPLFDGYRIFVGGHSKGGNLAVYSCAKSGSERICKIYNFDGPGFSKESLNSEPFLRIKDKVVFVFPQSSIIGMLFNHFEKFTVVKSTEKLILQHDPFSWRLQALNFSSLPKLDDSSEIFFASFNIWFEKLSPQQRKEFVETLFGVLLASKAKSNSELAENGLKSAARILKAFATLKSEKRDAYLKVVMDFIKITGHEAKELIKL